MNRENSKPRRITEIVGWCERHMGEYFFMVSIAVVTGVICGLAAHFFKLLINCVSGVFFARIASGGFNWWLLAVPVAGILLTRFFTSYVVHDDLTHGVAILIRDIRQNKYTFRRNLTFSSIIGGTLTLGFGGSSGAEGPIAYTGAAIGSNIGQWLGLDRRQLRVLVACGASGGIAGIFTAPVGGMLFSLELLGIQLTTLPVMAVAIASVSAWLTAYACAGFAADLVYIPVEGFTISMLWPTLILGVACGIYSLYYTSVINHMDRVFGGISNHWIRALVGGLLIGAIVMLFPSMFSIGYPIIAHVTGGDPAAIAKGSVLGYFCKDDLCLPLCAGGILLFKCWAVTSTNSSGGVGGDFAPTLFAGCMAGYLFSRLAALWCGVELSDTTFAYLGMAGVMAGAIQAPLMTIFIVIEMTQCYTLALPVTICALVSYLTVKGVSLSTEYYPVVCHLLWFEHRERRARAKDPKGTSQK